MVLFAFRLTLNHKPCTTMQEQFLHPLTLSLFPYQLSQAAAAASVDNRVPTPGSAASTEANVQQLGHEVQVPECKLEIKVEKEESECGDAQLEPKPEVRKEVSTKHGCLWLPVIIIRCLCHLWIVGAFSICASLFSLRRKQQALHKPKKNQTRQRSSRSQWK